MTRTKTKPKTTPSYRSHSSAVAEWRRRRASIRRQLLRPPPRLSIAEWADRYRIVPPGTSPEPGPWRTDRVPYLRGIMDTLSDRRVQRVVAMLASQTGKTEVALNAIGYYIDQEPSPILVVQPNEKPMAEAFSKDRLAPMIAHTPALRDKIKPARAKDSGNQVLHKVFPGGYISITGANSPAGLASRPIRVVLLDEVDRYPPSAGAEGDPVSLAIQRTANFAWTKKIYIVSTPTIKGHSRIEREWERSDQRRFFVPCPECGHMQHLRWGGPGEPGGLKWEKSEYRDDLPHHHGDVRRGNTVHHTATASYECEQCRALIPESAKTWMLRCGQWRATNPDGQFPGFHLNALYSPWVTWQSLAEEWLEKKDNPEALRTFINTKLAEPYEERGEAPDWQRIYERRESYPMGRCPEGVVFLTAGVDVQADRIEAYVWGWGYDKESWLIDHVVIPGDPYNPETWPGLTELLHRSYPTAAGETLPIARLAIDTGYAQETVIDWARKVRDPRVMLIKGDHWKNWTIIVGSPSRTEVTYRGRKTGLQLWPVGGALIKQETYGFLRLSAPVDGQPYPPGWIHLPMVDEEVVQQLVAEDLVTRADSRGFTVREWVKHRPRNEALDCRVYARAAAEQIGLSRMERPAEPKQQRPAQPETEDRVTDVAPRRRGARGGDWLDIPRRRGGWL